MNVADNKTYDLKTIYFYLTEGCNLRCRHCWLAPKYDPDGTKRPVLNLELFEKIIKQGIPLGLTRAKLTGGEPLLHPKINEIIDIVNDNGLKLSMETNALLLTKEMARKIASVEKKPFVSISIDGADADAHDRIRGVEGSFEKAVKGIENLAAEGIKPQVILTIMEHNKGHVEGVIRLAEKHGAKSVKFNVVQPASRGRTMHDDGETLGIKELVEMGRYIEKELSPKTGLKIYLTFPHAFRALGRMFDDEGGDCAMCGILGILGVLPNGSYALCGVGEVIPEMNFGHAEKDSLKNVWETNTVLQSLRNGLPKKLKGICKQCLMKHVCRGGCIAQNYYSSRDLWAPFWFCKMAEDAGIFPESRKVPKQT